MMVSVIMSVYNSDKYLREAVDSILNQSYIDFELVMVDDGSTDNTWQILEEYEEKDSRIILLKNKVNMGLTKNLNRAIAISKGKYIARMDADDISNLNRLEVQVKFLEKNINIDVVGSFSENIDESGNIIGDRKVPIRDKDIKRMLLIASPMSHPTVMMRKRSFEKIGWYNEKYKRGQDYEMWFRAVAKGMNFENIPEKLFKYRMDSTYLDRKKSFEKYLMNEVNIRREGYKHINLPIYKMYYMLVPIIIYLTPRKLFKILKMLDPRDKSKEKNSEYL